MKMLLVIFCLSVIITPAVKAQNKQAAIDSYFDALIANGQFNGNVLVAEKGNIIYEHSIGLADAATGVSNKPSTAFAIASISKTITATAILQLAEKGKLTISEPVAHYLPGFPYSNITLQHLLSHSSGLPPYNAFFDSLRKGDPTRVFTNADLIKGLAANPKPLLYPPGEKGNYDNINFAVLALVIEKVSGMHYEEYIRENILKPSGMRNTFPVSISTQLLNTKPSYEFAFPHLQPHLYSDSLVKAADVPYITSYWKAYEFSGFGQYISTTNDLLKYARAWNNNLLLTAGMKRLAFTPVKLNNGQNNAANFGLGWQVYKDSSLGKVIYHNGNATGHSCILINNISKQQTIIVFDNIHGDNSRQTAFDILKILNDAPVAPPKKSLARLYGKLLSRHGATLAADSLYKLKADTLHYYLSEDEMNVMGYDFFGGVNHPNPYRFAELRKYDEAIATFKLNTVLFPLSWNTWDSYGEALLATGKKEEAIQAYKRSVELNPGNEGGKKVLEEIKKQ